MDVGTRRTPAVDVSGRVPRHSLGMITLAGADYPLIDCGAWTAVDSVASAVTYQAGNLVESGGLEYVALPVDGNTNQEPPNAAYWQEFVEKEYFLRSDRIWAKSAVSSARALYTGSVTVGASTNGPVEFAFGSGTELLDVTNPFSPAALSEGVYSLALSAEAFAAPVNKTFGISFDVNNLDLGSGPSGFVAANFPYDQAEPTVRAWGAVSITWFMAAGDTIDAGINNGDSSPHAFAIFLYVQKIT